MGTSPGRWQVGLHQEGHHGGVTPTEDGPGSTGAAGWAIHAKTHGWVCTGVCVVFPSIKESRGEREVRLENFN